MKMHTFFRKLLISLFAIAFFTHLQAQNLPVKIQVITPVPPPYSSTELMQRLNEPMLVITNIGANNQQIALFGRITANNGITVTLDPKIKKPSRPVMLNGFSTITLSLQDIANDYSNYNINDLAIQGINLNSFLQNQLVPEGNYDLCVTAYDFNSLNQLSDNAPNGCSQLLQIIHPEPPIITNPLNEAEVLVSSFQNINIQWTPVRAGTFNAKYKLRMVEVPNGVNPYDAMRSNNFVWLNEEKLLTPFFLYDNTRPKLKEETTYALQVQAFDPNEIVPIKNKGFSDIILFKTKKLRGEPAVLRAPINASFVNYNQNGPYLFTWNAAPIPGFQTNHRLNIWEVPENSKPIEAMTKPELRILEQKDILGNSFNVIQEANRLEPGKRYAWQIVSSEPVGEILFNNSGASEIETFQVGYPELPVPRIILPTANIIDHTMPMEVNVQWEHILNYNNINVRYNLKVWEFNEAPRNINNAIANAEPIINLANIQRLNKRITGSDLYFSPGKFYAIQVVAFGNQLQFVNDGRSNVVSFSIGQQANNFACNQGCEARRANGRAVNSINNGATVTIGNFRVQLDNVIKTGNEYNGEARIIAGNYFDAPLRIILYNMTFNGNGQSLSGYAEAAFDQAVSVPNSWKSENANLLPIAVLVANRLNALANNAYQIGSRSNSVQKLPIGFNNIYITYLKLMPTTAVATLTSFKRLSGDINVGDVYLLFGKNNVCFSPGGPAVGADQSFLPALNDASVAENTKMQLSILKQMQNAPNGGTYLSFDCSGALDVSAFGFVAINLPGWNAGNQFLDFTSLYATFRTSFRNWTQWMADLRFVSAGERTNLNAANQVITITNRNFNHISVELGQALLDHSGIRNPNGLTLPEGHFSILNQEENNVNINIGGVNTPVNVGRVNFNLNYSPDIWNGIFLYDAKLVNIAYLPMQNERSKSYIRNFVIDANGLSGESDLLGEMLTPHEYVTSLNDWAFQLTGGSCKFMENEFVYLRYSGNSTIPLFTGTTPISIEHVKAGNRINSQITSQIIANTTKSIPALNAQLRLNRNAFIAGLFPANLEYPILMVSLSGNLDFNESIGRIDRVNLTDIGVSDFVFNNISQINQANRNANFVSGGVFNFANVRNASILGYPVNLTGMRITNENLDGIGNAFKHIKLSLDYALKLDNDPNGLSGISSVIVRMAAENSPISNFIQNYTNTTDINFNNVLVAGSNLNGDLILNTTEEGLQEFGGTFQINVLGYETDATARFGNFRGTPFWHFAYEQVLPNPLPIGMGLATRAFGGGLYKNMTKGRQQPRGGSVNDVILLPPNARNYRDINTFGISMGTILCTMEGGLFNGRFLLELDMRNGGLDNVRLSGKAHFFDETPPSYWLNNVEPSNAANFKLNGEINYNHRTSTLEGLFGYNMRFMDGTITGHGNDNVGFRFSPRDWYIRIGTRRNPINARLNVGPINADATAYFNTSGNLAALSRAVESLSFGVNGDINATTGSIKVPFTRRDRVRASARLTFNFEGHFGLNSPYCRKNPNDFFAYLEAGIDARANLEYWENCDSWFFFFSERRCEEWQTIASAGVGGNLKLYSPSPTGMRACLRIRIPVVNETIEPCVQFGTECEN